ncbi:MAG: LolA-like outer membrane lipoprotein chaperone [Campylobacteraceae bacterium]|nr:LolA-like outer membrane lipoprotein chaperone [Campylobacteraceae bacterium]
MKILSFFILFLSVVCAQDSIKSISSDFTQVITSTEGDSLKYEGSLQALNDGSENFALWIYKNPIEKKIYFTNNRVVMIEPDLEQAVITSVEEIPDMSSILNQALNTNKLTNKDVNVTVLDTIYNISFKNGIPAKISYIDKLDNKIDILLKNTNLNINIYKLTFQVEIPKNFDVVRY